MAASRAASTLIDTLPKVRGRYEALADLGKLTWFRVGGPAEVLYAPADADDLQMFLKERPQDVPLTFIGLGANMLVRDGGVPGVVIQLGKAFGQVSVAGLTMRVGAGAVNAAVASAAKDASIGGLEFLVGIPGTIGGALRMNAGAYGREIKDVFQSATGLNTAGDTIKLDAAQMGFGYRHTEIADDWIFIAAELKGERDTPSSIAARMKDIRTEREESQPTQARTGGSTFANPEGFKAWQLIDEAGCRGLTVGGAQISEKHTNFMLNTGGATATDLENLGEQVRKRVFEETGIHLVWEIRRVGVTPKDPRALQAPPKKGGK